MDRPSQDVFGVSLYIKPYLKLKLGNLYINTTHLTSLRVIIA
jgi:hypothetical protein